MLSKHPFLSLTYFLTNLQPTMKTTYKIFSKTAALTAIACSVALLTACGGGGGGDLSDPISNFAGLDQAYMTSWQTNCGPVENAPGNSGKILQEIKAGADGKSYDIRLSVFSYNGTTCSGAPIATAFGFTHTAVPKGTMTLSTGEVVQKIELTGKASAVTVVGSGVTDLGTVYRVRYSNGRFVDIKKSIPASKTEKDIYLVSTDGKSLYYGNATDSKQYPTTLDKEGVFNRAKSPEALFQAAGIAYTPF